MYDLIPWILVIAVIWLIRNQNHVARQNRELESRLLAMEIHVQALRQRPVEGVVPPAPAAIPEARVEPRPPVAQPEAAPHSSFPPTMQAPPVIESMSGRDVPPPIPKSAYTPPHRISAPAPEIPESSINWENFTGVRLFAWIGGLLLLLGTAYFIKLSIDNNWVSPAMRVTMGYVAAVGILVGGWRMRSNSYKVLSHTLCATGIVMLYAITFGAHSFYHLIPSSAATFAVMILITAAAFLLAIRRDAQVIAVLGIFGGFLTPLLLSDGHNRPIPFFSYITLLNIGLACVAINKKWNYLTFLGLLGTLIMEFGWTVKYFDASQIHLAISVYLGFSLLFFAILLVSRRLQQLDIWISASAIAQPMAAMAFALYLVTFASIGARPGLLLGFILALDLILVAIAFLRDEASQLHVLSGLLAFALLTAWSVSHLTHGILNWALGASLLFAVLHSVIPIVMQRLRPEEKLPVGVTHLFPPIALILMMLHIHHSVEVSFAFWICILLLDVVAVILAMATASILSLLGVLVLTLGSIAFGLGKIPSSFTGFPSLLGVIGGFSIFFFLASIFASNFLKKGALATRGGAFALSNHQMAQVPALSAVLPFLLLIMATLQLPLLNPSSVFGLALLLVILLLGLARFSKIDSIVPAALVSSLALLYAWHTKHFTPEAATLALGWYLTFYLLFTIYPFLVRDTLGSRSLPWAAAALSGPLHFYLLYNVVSTAWPNPYMGLLPALLSIPSLLGLIVLLKTVPPESENRNTQLALFGGAALFFITFIFPIQFERSWLTLGWALEGAALIWLFRRVPHAGLRLVGTALLVICFGRLLFIPGIFERHARSDTRIFNSYLYLYGITALCLGIGAKLLESPRNRIGTINVQPLLYGLATLLAFALLNLEIADFFATGDSFRISFSENLARDTTHSIAWALFAFVLLVIGMVRKIPAARYAGMALLGITLVKVFFHDLGQLASMYRIAAAMGVGIILLVVSFLYQRFISKQSPQNAPPTS